MSGTLPELMDDLVDEIIIRFPPGEPELLVRASLVCKRWCRLISDPAFRRRFRQLHRASSPPMLGVMCTRLSVSSFVPTSSVPVPHAMFSNWRAIDSRHGRVLLHTLRCPEEEDFPMLSAGNLLVWDPITDEQWALPKLPGQLFSRLPCSWTAAVLCAAADGTCDHIDCHSGGSFLVVFMCIAPREAFTCNSSETGAWSEPTSAQLHRARVYLAPCVPVGNTLYCISDYCRRSMKVVEHDMETQETSLIRLPRTNYTSIALVKMVDGRLGFTAMNESKLYLWSREAGSEKYAGWAQSRVIDLETLLRPLGTLVGSLNVICFVDGVAGIFMSTHSLLVFAIDLKSGRITKIGERMGIYNIVPYMSFYTPALVAAATGEGPRPGAPSS